MASFDKEQGEREGEARRTHVSAGRLRARGWPAGLVRRLLGEPDLLLGLGPHRSGPPLRLYRIERVEAAERSEEFRAATAAAARRIGAVRSAVVRAAVRRRRRGAGGNVDAEAGGGADHR